MHGIVVTVRASWIICLGFESQQAFSFLIFKRVSLFNINSNLHSDILGKNTMRIYTYTNARCWRR